MGHAGQLQAWGELVADHLDHSPRLQLAVMLVGCTRGPCAVDRQVLRHIGRAGVPLLPVLTKADLLAPEDLAASHAVVSAQLRREEKARAGPTTAP